MKNTIRRFKVFEAVEDDSTLHQTNKTMAQETIEEAAKRLFYYEYGEETYVTDQKRDAFIEGVKWQEKRMLEFMDAYANDVMGGCTLTAKEWYEKLNIKTHGTISG